MNTQLETALHEVIVMLIKRTQYLENIRRFYESNLII